MEIKTARKYRFLYSVLVQSVSPFSLIAQWDRSGELASSTTVSATLKRKRFQAGIYPALFDSAQ